MRKTPHFKTHKAYGHRIERKNSGTIDYSADTSFRVKLTKLGLRRYRRLIKAKFYYLVMVELGYGDECDYDRPGQLYTCLSYIERRNKREYVVHYHTAYDV